MLKRLLPINGVTLTLVAILLSASITATATNTGFTTISATFDQTLALLAAAQGSNPAAWTGPRGSITFTHPIIGVVASIPNSNRATYGQIVVLGRPHISGESIFTLGQSGFLRLVLPGSFAFDPHFLDQLGLFRNFEYKPMRFFRNTQLKE